MPKLFYVEKSDDGYYHILMDGVQDYFLPLKMEADDIPFTYNNIYFSLFNLSPKDFFSYVCSYYHATAFAKENIYWPWFAFKNEDEAKIFVAECNLRFNYCIRNFFTQEGNNENNRRS